MPPAGLPISGSGAAPTHTAAGSGASAARGTGTTATRQPVVPPQRLATDDVKPSCCTPTPAAAGLNTKPVATEPLTPGPLQASPGLVGRGKAALATQRVVSAKTGTWGTASTVVLVLARATQPAPDT